MRRQLLSQKKTKDLHFLFTSGKTKIEHKNANIRFLGIQFSTKDDGKMKISSGMSE